MFRHLSHSSRDIGPKGKGVVSESGLHENNFLSPGQLLPLPLPLHHSPLPLPTVHKEFQIKAMKNGHCSMCDIVSRGYKIGWQLSNSLS